MRYPLNLRLDNWTLNRLAEPFPVEEVRFLPSFGGGGGAMPYIEARTIMDRLNRVVGAENWRDSYEESTIVNTEERDITDYPLLLEQGKATKKGSGTYQKIVPTAEGYKDIQYTETRYGGIRCNLTVLGVTKSDVGAPSFAEQLKGAYSDALKRAGVKFGIGAYFYKLGVIPATVEQGRIKGAVKLPSWAIPVERANPDDVLQATINQVLDNTELPDNKREYATGIIDNVMAMGSYNPDSPLIVKRAVYEELKRLGT